MNERSKSTSELARYVKLRTGLLDKLMVLRVSILEVERKRQAILHRARKTANWKVSDQELEEVWNKTDQGKQEAALKHLACEAESAHQRLNDLIRRLREGEDQQSDLLQPRTRTVARLNSKNSAFDPGDD
jgi:hypothetical protein